MMFVRTRVTTSLQLPDFFPAPFRILVHAGVGIGIPEVVPGSGKEGVKFNRFLIVPDCLNEVAISCEFIASCLEGDGDM